MCLSCHMRGCSRIFFRKKYFVMVFTTSIIILFIQVNFSTESLHRFHIRTRKWIVESMNSLTSVNIFNSPVCSPKVNISFTKTHKTGSSSLQNMFMRFALTHNYTLLLPKKRNYFGNPLPFNHKWATKLKKGLAYNILCHHHRWNPWNLKEIKKVMPPNTLYITLIRKPTEVFESMFSYYDLYKYFNVNLTKFASTSFNETIHNYRAFGRFGRNQMSFDLGLKVTDFENETKIDEFISKIDNQFSLVMVNELMNESLILLKHLLCWSLDDIIMFHHNARLPKAKAVLNETLIENLKTLHKADLRLYDYFLKVLKRKINDFGEREMQKEVEELKKRTDEWFEFCVEGLKLGKYLKREFQPYHPKTYGFRLREDSRDNMTCEALALSELSFTRKHRTRQNSSYVE